MAAIAKKVRFICFPYGSSVDCPSIHDMMTKSLPDLESGCSGASVIMKTIPG